MSQPRYRHYQTSTYKIGGLSRASPHGEHIGMRSGCTDTTSALRKLVCTCETACTDSHELVIHWKDSGNDSKTGAGHGVWAMSRMEQLKDDSRRAIRNAKSQ